MRVPTITYVGLQALPLHRAEIKEKKGDNWFAVTVGRTGIWPYVTETSSTDTQLHLEIGCGLSLPSYSQLCKKAT